MPETFTLDPATDIRNQNGAPAWFELVTPDPDAAREFLSATFGWGFVPYPAYPGYHVAEVQGHGVGGVRGPMPDEPDPGPRWVTFVTVDDVDATVAAAQEAEAQVVMPPTDMEGVGRMTIYSHPASGMMYVMQYTQPFG